MSKKQIKHESFQDIETVKNYLQQIIDGIEGGNISVTSGTDEVTLVPSGLIQLQVNATQKKSRHLLGIKLSWTPGDAPLDLDEELLTIKTAD